MQHRNKNADIREQTYGQGGGRRDWSEEEGEANCKINIQVSSVQLFSRVQLFATP